MADDYSYADDDSFTDYTITSVDPGSSILIITLLFCVSLYCCLPCVVALCNHLQRRHNDTKKRDLFTVEDIEPVTAIDSDDHDVNDDDADNQSQVSSSTISSASVVIGVLLDAAQEVKSPGRRGGSTLGGRRLNRDAVLQREHTEERSEQQTSGRLGETEYDDPSLWSLLDDSNPTEEAKPPVAPNCNKGEAGIAAQPNVRTNRLRRNPWKACSSTISRNFEKLLSIVEFDYETKRIYKLALPYVAQALVSGIAWNAILVIIGQLLGTRQVSAYAVVDLMVGLTSESVGGIAGSLITLLGFSRGTNNPKLTGQYLQIALVMYTVLSIPFIVMWALIMKDVMLSFGFDSITANIGHSFAVPFALSRLLHGITNCVHCVMDVFDLAYVSTMVVGAGEIANTLAVLLAALFWKPSLEFVGYLFVGVELAFLVLTVFLVTWRGWFRPFHEGLLHTFALKNTTAVKQMLKTASSLTAGYLLTYGEWEVLAIFAGFLGPAEVAAWSMLGTLWSSVELATFAVGDASEVRVALLLGSGQPRAAKKSAYKSIFIAFVFSLCATSIIFIAGDDLPSWLTTDPVLQEIIFEVMPLLGIGTVAMTMGSMAWTLVGAQNRYRLATAIGVAGSWFITIPLSALLSVVYRMDLQGQTAAVVIGYMVSGFVTNVILLRSDWKKLSDDVILHNAEEKDGNDGDVVVPASIHNGSESICPSQAPENNDSTDEILHPSDETVSSTFPACTAVATDAEHTPPEDSTSCSVTGVEKPHSSNRWPTISFL